MSVKDDVLEVQKHFPNAYCISYDGGYCIAWAFDMEPIIATGRKPEKAWRAAAKMVSGKSKKQIAKLKLKLTEKEMHENSKP